MDEPLFHAQSLSKHYPGVTALSEVSFNVRRGSVVGLLGENGAGKSTLLDLMSGVEAPDEGSMTLAGTEYAPKNYSDANREGVFRVFQHQSLLTPLRVYENMYLSHERRFSSYGLVSHRSMRRAAQAVLDETGHGHIDANATVRSLNYSTRQIVEVIKALAVARLLEIEAPIVLLDEPTTALEQHEVRFLFDIIERLRASASFVFVSHRLNEILEVCDRIEVLKDGRHNGSFDNEQTVTIDQLHRAMVGRAVSGVAIRQKVTRGSPESALRVDDLSRRGMFEHVSFDLNRGEVLGIAGLLGSGKGDLARSLFERNWDDGAVSVSGEVVAKSTGPSGSIRSKIAFVPEDRHHSGIVLDFPVDWNISLPSISGSGPLLDLRGERRAARTYQDALNIRTRSAKSLARTLSGGNQQKVVLAKWLMSGAQVFILENPTFGVDVGAREDIYRLFVELVDNGVSILLISDDLPELIGLSDRILIMRDGHLAAEIPASPEAKPSEEELIRHMSSVETVA